MCKVHTGAYLSSLTPLEKPAIPLATQGGLPRIILHVVSITTHTRDRRKSIGYEKQIRKKKIKERNEKRRKRNKTKKARKEKDKKARNNKTRRGSKERKKKKGRKKQTKERKMSY